MLYKGFYISQYNISYYYICDKPVGSNDGMYLNKLGTLLDHTNVQRSDIPDSYHRNAYYRTVAEAKAVIDRYLVKPIVSRRV